jgi:lambda repressor-like predicted transcriptional regulator
MESKTMEDFRIKVKVELLNRGENLRIMAIRLGLNYDYLLQVLTGKRNSEEYVAKVREYLGISE